ncbi:hypothetical protein PF011_g30682, partial [Phytophthora fragariae]
MNIFSCRSRCSVRSVAVLANMDGCPMVLEITATTG